MAGIFALISFGAKDVYFTGPPDNPSVENSGWILDKYPKNFISLNNRDKYRLASALDLYDSYITLKLCINKIKKDVNHPLWLPTELWSHILKFLKISIETFTIGSNDKYINPPNMEELLGENRSYQYTTLYELEAYKQELKIIKENPKNTSSKKKFSKIINTRKQIRIDNYKRKIYAY